SHISADSLPPYLRKRKLRIMTGYSQKEGVGRIAPLEKVEKDHILRAYEQMGKVKTQTAMSLAIGLNTLRRKLQAYGVA
ncbi:MAG: helix-turn-helix domain-containing protein, partial [Desulfobacteria bacterium]